MCELLSVCLSRVTPTRSTVLASVTMSPGYWSCGFSGMDQWEAPLVDWTQEEREVGGVIPASLPVGSSWAVVECLSQATAGQVASPVPPVPECLSSVPPLAQGLEWRLVIASPGPLTFSSWSLNSAYTLRAPSLNCPQHPFLSARCFPLGP